MTDEIREVTRRRMGIKEKEQAGSEKKNSGDKGVVKLDANSFNQILMNDNEKAWFVKFYAPWCGHCKALAPTWIELAAKMEGRIKIAEVDATVEMQLAQKFNVQGYPTLLMFPSGRKSTSGAIPYHGGRDLGSMVQFANRYATAVVRQLTSHSQFSENCDKNLCLLAFLPNLRNTNPTERKQHIKVIRDLANSDAGASLPVKYFWVEGENTPHRFVLNS